MTAKEVPRQQGKIFHPLAQGRQMYGNHVKPIEKIFRWMDRTGKPAGSRNHFPNRNASGSADETCDDESSNLMATEKFDILVADDEQSMREFLEIVLSNEGYRVCCVSSGEEAIECLRTSGARVFLQDLRMGGLDGMQLLEAATEPWRINTLDTQDKR